MELHVNLWCLLNDTNEMERKMVKVLKCFEILNIPQEKSEAKVVLNDE